MADLTRRSVLRMAARASVGAAGLFALSAVVDPLKPLAAPQAPAPFDPPTAGKTLPTKLTGSFVSAARGGIKTNWVIAMPPGQTKMLRPVIALHGKDGDANMMLDCGVEDALAQLVAAGKPPFAVVGVDGGASSYWHRRSNGEDSGTMVIEELLPMLSSMGMDTSRVGFLGWSMGGYGAMLLAGERAEQGLPVGPVVATSPAVWEDYDDVRPGAFDSAEDFATYGMFGRRDLLEGLDVRVDCGRGDPFFHNVSDLVDGMDAEVHFAAGAHNGAYWTRVLPDQLDWIGDRISATGAQ